MIEQALNQSTETIYFFNVLKNRLDTKVKRGAIVKALAIGCRQKVMLEPLSKMIETALDLIYDAQDLKATPEKNILAYTAVISELYKCVNSYSSDLL